MDGHRGDSSRGHRPHCKVRPQDRVAAGKDSSQIRRERSFAGGNPAGCNAQAFALGQCVVHHLSNRRDHGGALDGEIGTRHFHRPAAAGSVRFAEGHSSAGQQDAASVLLEQDRRRQEIDAHAFGFGGIHFLHQARHLLPAAPVEDSHVPRAQPEGRAGAVDCGVAAADHDDVVAQRRGVFQKVHAGDGVFLALAAERLRALCPDGQEHGVVPFPQFGEAEVLAPARAHLECRAEFSNDADLRIERILR